MIIFEYIKLIYYLIHPRSIFIKGFSSAIGDSLLLSSVLPHVRKKYPDKKIIVKTSKPELFLNNPYPDWVTSRHIKTTKKFIRPKYHIWPDKTESVYLQMMQYFGFNFEGTPEIYLSEKEINSVREEFDFDYIAVCPTGKQGFCGNRKEWGFDKFQKVVNSFPQIKFVQIGLENDTLLDNVIDRRGKNIRYPGAIIKNSLFFFGLEGGLMHIAKAVGKRAVIIYGGVILEESTGYQENINITNKIYCSPCYNSDKKIGDCEHMTCMKEITHEVVIENIAILLKKIGSKKYLN